MGQLCSLSLLVEETKAGKIVGPKAATIQELRNKSGALQIRMLKHHVVNELNEEFVTFV